MDTRDPDRRRAADPETPTSVLLRDLLDFPGEVLRNPTFRLAIARDPGMACSAGIARHAVIALDAEYRAAGLDGAPEEVRSFVEFCDRRNKSSFRFRPSSTPDAFTCTPKASVRAIRKMTPSLPRRATNPLTSAMPASRSARNSPNESQERSTGSTTARIPSLTGIRMTPNSSIGSLPSVREGSLHSAPKEWRCSRCEPAHHCGDPTDARLNPETSSRCADDHAPRISFSILRTNPG